MQKKINPNKQELNDSDSSFASSKEEELNGKREEEKKNEKEEEENEEEEEEEKVKEMEEHCNTEGEEENIKQIWSKAENKEEEYVDKSGGKEHSRENEHEREANLFKCNNEVCNVQNDKMQGGTNICEAFISGHSESSHDHAITNKVNRKLPEHSIEKKSSYENQIQKLQKPQDTDNNNKLSYENQKRFCKNVFFFGECWKNYTLYFLY